MENLTTILQNKFARDGVDIWQTAGEAVMTVPTTLLPEILPALRDDENLRFEILIDLAGVDYSQYEGGMAARYAVVYHFLSLTHNRRLRLRAFCDDEDFPQAPSAISVWPCADWYEREAFDLYGIVFDGHPDLRRILTDYGFVGHPFRKDFPISGHVEMRYDEDKKRVIYVPVSIEPREVTPRIVREESFAKGRDNG